MDWFYLYLSLSIKTVACKTLELNIAPGLSSLSVAAAAIYMASHASDRALKKKEIRQLLYEKERSADLIVSKYGPH
jgi:transcription initiation factor TFIIIB Brf1 subunit/transcription initiation factor TFIIB